MTLTKRQHERTLKIIQKLMDKNPDRRTLEGQTLRILAEIVERYEREKFPISDAERAKAWAKKFKY
jgi:antitoxin component HigA of HigAB toxin-antitoxin module